MVFTPLTEDKTKRLTFPIEEVEVLSGDLDTRGVGKKARVKIYNEVYDVFGTACNLPHCQCDAYIKPVKEKV